MTISKNKRKLSSLAIICLLTVPILMISGCASANTNSMDTPGSASQEPKEIHEITECERSMYTASEEPDSTRAEVFIKQTAYNCGGAAEWYEALRQYPQALGFNNVQGDELEIICHKWKKAPVCKNP
jgi:hypothetical protein